MKRDLADGKLARLLDKVDADIAKGKLRLLKNCHEHLDK
jgi:hypothetical protein